MANNRMWLVEKNSGKRILLCKYYYHWQLWPNEEEFNSWLSACSEEDEEYNPDIGMTSFELEFETKGPSL